MSKYLHYFEVDGPKYERERKVNYKEPWASYVDETSEVKYNKTEEEKEDEELNTPLTFEVLNDGVIRWKAQSTAYTTTIEYRKNIGEWVSITSATGNSVPSISVVAGDIVEFRGDNATYTTSSTTTLRYNFFSGTTCGFKVYGNIMSLIVSEGFSGVTTLASSYTFYNLFNNCTGLTSAENLILPATTLTQNCYTSMFNGCTSLTQAPSILPATTFQGWDGQPMRYCYQGMFSGCTSLVSAPELPATSLAYGCYQYMFQGCTSLTQAPELPATSLADDCYHTMFAGCRSLTTAPELPATRLAPHSYQDMFSGCTGLTVTPVFCATTLANYCCEGMFRNCSRLVTIHSLPATSVTTGCYQYMFAGCTSLTTAPELLATTLANNCYQYMFQGCKNLTQAPELPAPTLVNYSYRGMFDGCTKLNYIKCLATNISATESHNYWVSGVASSGTFVKAASMSSWPTGTSGIPNNWTVQDAS